MRSLKFQRPNTFAKILSVAFIPYTLVLCSNTKLIENCAGCRNNNTEEISYVDYDYVKKLHKYPRKLLIDVRRKEEIEATGLIPTSINIPLVKLKETLNPFDQNEKMFKSVYGRNKPKRCTEIIFTCRTGKRALAAAGHADDMGYNNLRVYKGSWIDWAKHEGLS